MIAMSQFNVVGGVIFIALFSVFATSAEGEASGGLPIPQQPLHSPRIAPQPPVLYAPAPEPAPLWPPCDGVDIVYINNYTARIYPFLDDTPWLQPYRFESIVTITNMGYSTVEAWAMGIDFQHNEVSIISEPHSLNQSTHALQFIPCYVTSIVTWRNCSSCPRIHMV